jgi:hypothetical protein
VYALGAVLIRVVGVGCAIGWRARSVAVCAVLAGACTFAAIADLDRRPVPGLGLSGRARLPRHPRPAHPDRLDTAHLFAALRDNLRPVVTVDEFAADLAAAGDQDPEDYHAYGLSDADISRLVAAFTTWAAQLRATEALVR